MNKLIVAAAVAVLAWAGVSGSVLAADLTVPVDTAVLSGVNEGDRVELAVVASDELAGLTCGVRSLRFGDGDVRMGNDLIVSSGGASTTLSDVEREPAAVTEASPIVLAELVSIELVMGSDGEYAGDVVVEFDCRPSEAAAVAGLASDQPESSESAGEGAVTPVPAAGTGEMALPSTGSETTVLVLLGASLLVAGWLLMRSTRRPSATTSGDG